jgi:hypothetical protein
MKVEVYKCDRCETIITADNGIIVHGNIYTAEVNKQWLFGNGFPTFAPFKSEDVAEKHLCAHCFSKEMTPEFIKSIVDFATPRPKSEGISFGIESINLKK